MNIEKLTEMICLHTAYIPENVAIELAKKILSALNEKQCPTDPECPFCEPKKIEPLNKIDELPRKHWQPIMQLANKINELVEAYNRRVE